MTTNDKTRAHLHISGHVQGVGFRHSTKQNAQRLGLTGWVKNLFDGRVEAIFEGDQADVEQIVQWCHEGPRSAQVNDVSVDYAEYKDEFSGFNVRF